MIDAERRRRVEQDEVVGRHALERVAQAVVLVARVLGDLVREQRQRLVRRDDVEIGMTRALHRQRRARLLAEQRVEQEVQRGAARGADVDAEHLAELPLRVEIDQQHALAALARQVVTDAGRERRLAAAALLVDEGDAASDD